MAILLSVPGQIWNIILCESGYNLKTMFHLITTTKQTTGCQRKTTLEELACHLERSRRYHRVHWNFDEDLQRRLAHLRLVSALITRHLFCIY